MQYRTLGRSDRKVSILGFGCMRLPILEDAGNAMNFFERQIPLMRKKRSI